MTTLKLATCSYQEFQPTMGRPVRSTVGAPRFRLGYPLAGHAKLVTPTWAMVRMGEADAYEFAYRRMLEANGLDAIRAELAKWARPAAPVVLLCFDRLNEPGSWCHRTMLARWLREQTGEEVPELGAVRAPELF